MLTSETTESGSGGYVYYQGEWWFVVSEEPRDMVLIALGKKQKRVSWAVLEREIPK